MISRPSTVSEKMVWGWHGGQGCKGFARLSPLEASTITAIPALKAGGVVAFGYPLATHQNNNG